METGDEEDEWRREEELASMNCSQPRRDSQRQGQTSVSPSPATGEASRGRGGHASPFASFRSEAQQWALRPSHPPAVPQTSPPEPPQEIRSSLSQVPASLSASWLVSSNSRKRTHRVFLDGLVCGQLQDRTQFSNADLLQLKRYWEHGMTSLGSVCRQKISAAAKQLNVDAEIVKTWISNRRRKYRLMAIDIPPPSGGPAVFGSSSPGGESLLALSPEGEDGFRTPELGEDLTDGGSLCLSEDGETSESYQREGEDSAEELNVAPLANDVKVEVIDDYQDDDDGGGDDDVVASDVDHMRNLLEYKHEEVQYLEGELGNQRQKYQELQSFTRSLLAALRNHDLEKQQELLASLPQSVDQEWDTTPERGVQLASTTTAPSDLDEGSVADISNNDTSLVTVNEEFPLITINEDGSSVILNNPSASEERETQTENKQE